MRAVVLLRAVHCMGACCFACNLMQSPPNLLGLNRAGLPEAGVYSMLSFRPQVPSRSNRFDLHHEQRGSQHARLSREHPFLPMLWPAWSMELPQAWPIQAACPCIVRKVCTDPDYACPTVPMPPLLFVLLQSKANHTLSPIHSGGF